MLSIRQIGEEGFDLDTVKALFREYDAFLHALDARLLPLAHQDMDAEMASLPGRYDAPRGNLYLAFWDGEPVGCAAFYPMNDTTCELKRMYVSPKTQGKRIGLSLLERAVADARAKGYQFMRLDSIRRLEAAGRLYQRYGFTEIEPYNVNEHPDVYYMELALAPSGPALTDPARRDTVETL